MNSLLYELNYQLTPLYVQSYKCYGIIVTCTHTHRLEGFNFIYLFIQCLYSALFTNKRALMRCLTNRILIFTKKCSLKSKLFM